MRFSLRPLFFLPRPILRWAHEQAMHEHLLDTPLLVLFIEVTHAGIWFPYRGDEVCWTWPWRRAGKAPFISLMFSGDGSFGDARYRSLKEMDDAWEEYGNLSCPGVTRGFTAAEDLQAGDLVALTEDGKHVRKVT